MECEKREYQVQAVCFAASTAVFIACFERAVVRSFIEQWRVLMFLALNLLLLAILFTSTRPSLSTQELQNSNGFEDFEAESKKKMKKQSTPFDNGEIVEQLKLVNCIKINEAEVKGVESVDAVAGFVEVQEESEELEGESLKEQSYELSKEELNERAEAFIAMFRQHLISDAKGRSCRRVHSSSQVVCPCTGVVNHSKS